PFVVAESHTNPTFQLKATVRESRLTNGITPGSFFQVDRRLVTDPAFGGNILPAVQRDRGTGAINIYWASNRQNNFAPALNDPNVPWYLFFTSLNAASPGMAPLNPIYDWRFESQTGQLTRW